MFLHAYKKYMSMLLNYKYDLEYTKCDQSLNFIKVLNDHLNFNFQRIGKNNGVRLARKILFAPRDWKLQCCWV